MMRKVEQLPALIATVLVVVLGGCMAGEMGPSLEVVNSCSSTDDCAVSSQVCGPNDVTCPFTDGVCDQELGVCVSDRAIRNETLVITVSDPSLGTSAELEVGLDEADVQYPLEVALPDPVTVRGSVVDSRDGEQFIAARLTFTRQSTHEELAHEAIVIQSAETATEDDQGDLFTYQLQLTPGTYEVVVEPAVEAGEAMATRRYYPLRRVCQIPSDQCQTDFVYGDDTVVVESTVKDPYGELARGVKVYAFNADTGRRLSNVATIAIDSDEAGAFSLALPPLLEEEQFRLHISGVDENPFLPVLELGPYSISNDSDGDGRIVERELGELAYSPYVEDPVVYRNVVEGYGPDGALRSVEDATLTFRTVKDSTWLSTDGVFELSATTDESGAIIASNAILRDPDDGLGILLVPGQYEVFIDPPTGSEYEPLTTTITVEPPTEELPAEPDDLQLGVRALIEGVVRSPDGHLVPQVQIEAVSADGVPFVAATDEVGYFSMFVDRVIYDITFAPPDGSFLAWSRRVSVSAHDDLFLDVVVGWGTPISGVVNSSSQVNAAGSAGIAAYVERDDDPDGDSYLLPIGSDVTGEGGSFLFVLPEATAPAAE